MRYLAAILLFFWLPASAMGATFTLWDMFPISQGANNFYAYGYRYDGNPPVYREITKSSDYAFFTSNQTWSIPYLYKNANGWVYMHPSYQYGSVYGHEDALLAWKPNNTVPYEINVSGQFYGVNSATKYVYIRKDTAGDNLWSSYLNKYAVNYSVASFTLNPGETLYFGVNNGNNADTSDETRLSGTLTYTPVPLPGTLSLMLTGLGGLWAWRRLKQS